MRDRPDNARRPHGEVVATTRDSSFRNESDLLHGRGGAMPASGVVQPALCHGAGQAVGDVDAREPRVGIVRIGRVKRDRAGPGARGYDLTQVQR